MMKSMVLIVLTLINILLVSFTHRASAAEYWYGSDTVECVALNIYFEARGQPLIDQVAVTQVVLHRVDSSLYPNNPCDVIYQYKQFSWFWDGKSDIPKEKITFEICKILAGDIMLGRYPEVVPKALYYHSHYVKPKWIKGKIKLGFIGKHVFYR